MLEYDSKRKRVKKLGGNGNGRRRGEEEESD